MKHLFSSLLAITLFATASLADGVMSLGGSEWGEGQDSKVVIQFSADGKVSGNLGCNRFFGTYKQDGDKLTFGAVGSTRMMCPEAQMKTEARVSAALSSTSQAQISHLKLVLEDDKGTALLNLQRRDFD